MVEWVRIVGVSQGSSLECVRVAEDDAGVVSGWSRVVSDSLE
jgi:hypothetical protein